LPNYISFHAIPDETYLEQKSGFRILWTEEEGKILIWFVGKFFSVCIARTLSCCCLTYLLTPIYPAKHKSVSRLAKLIDDAKSRSQLQQVPEDEIISAEERTNDNSTKHTILLDALGNVPMKVYDVCYQNIDEIATDSWTPRMHLTKEEQEIVEAKGTVLLLGRSGTGKTVCIINRMEFDRYISGNESNFSQLFVSRSSRLCRYVETAVGGSVTSTFTTFDKLLHQLDSALPALENTKKSFLPSRRVSFPRFKREFYDGLKSTDIPGGALLVWKQIKTFLKGSLEAYQSPGRVLSRDYYTSDALGKNRCRLAPNLRQGLYDIFLKYEEYKESGRLWDECDRVLDILLRLDNVKTTQPELFDELRKNKIYVDEIQDYTQIEILLYFFLGGPGGLFLAGDGAQAVVEGTEFRFEEIRSVGYYISGDGSRQYLIPSKPKIVHVNFRSHRGILNTAASILNKLFSAFPSSAKRLDKDRGLFTGSKPGLCYGVDTKLLSSLLAGKMNGTVVLTSDESASRWKRVLDYELIMGIRESKGLEFKSCIILDYFADLPSNLQKPWRELLLQRADVNFERDYPLVETQLKLLYVAVTRTIERLLFVETSSSIAGDAAIRWLCCKTEDTPALASRNNVMDIEGMSLSEHDFLSLAIDNIQAVESPEIRLDEAIALVNRSIYCFDKANEPQLAAKARVHRRSIELRKELDDMTGLPSNDVVEAKAAQLVELLLREGLLEECKSLLSTVIMMLSNYARTEIEHKILAILT